MKWRGWLVTDHLYANHWPQFTREKFVHWLLEGKGTAVPLLDKLQGEEVRMSQLYTQAVEEVHHGPPVVHFLTSSVGSEHLSTTAAHSSGSGGRGV